MDKNKIYIGLGMILLLVLGMGGFFILKLQNVTTSFERHADSEGVIIAALDFNAENYHTQLEMWEYAFDPTEKRLAAFLIHEEKLDELLDALVVSSRDDSKLFVGGSSDIENIRGNVRQVKVDWVDLLASIKELENAKARGLGEGDEEYEVVEIKTADRVFANEELFDRLQFNRSIDAFVEKQEVFVGGIERELFAPINAFRMWLFVFVGTMVVLISGVGIWMSSSKEEEITK